MLIKKSLTAGERRFVNAYLANEAAGAKAAAINAGYAATTADNIASRPHVRAELKRRRQEIANGIDKGIVQQNLDLRAEVLRSLLAGVQMDSRVVEKALAIATGPRGGINGAVFSALLNWNTQSGKNLADILGLTDPRAHDLNKHYTDRPATATNLCGTGENTVAASGDLAVHQPQGAQASGSPLPTLAAGERAHTRQPRSHTVRLCTCQSSRDNPLK